MRAFGKQHDRMKKLCDLGIGVAVTKDRQAKRGLGDEHVALNELKGGTRWIANVFVIAGGHDAQAVKFDRDLGGTQDVAGWVEAHLDAAQCDGLTIADRLRSPGEVVAV